METKNYLKERVALLEKENQFLKDKLKGKKPKKLKLKAWKPKTEEDKLLEAISK